MAATRSDATRLRRSQTRLRCMPIRTDSTVRIACQCLRDAGLDEMRGREGWQPPTIAGFGRRRETEWAGRPVSARRQDGVSAPGSAGVRSCTPGSKLSGDGVHRSRPLRAPGERDRDVAGPAQQPVVLEAALAAAVRDRHDVIGFPPRPRRPPGPPRGAIGCRRLRARPLTVRLDDVEAAEPAGALVALLHLLPHVPRAAADLPFVHAGVAAERAPRRLHRPPAPAADRLAGVVALRLAPLIGGDDARAAGAHGLEYRSGSGSGGFRGCWTASEPRKSRSDRRRTSDSAKRASSSIH